MDIYIDESGSFVSTKDRGSWNAVAAFAIPEKNVPSLHGILNSAKQSIGCGADSEIKLKDFQGKECVYFTFLENLNALDAVLLVVAYDPSVSPLQDVIQHQRTMAATILDGADRMRYEGGRKGVELLGKEIACLSPQLYVQIMCQIELMVEVVDRSINYFAQRRPEALGKFTWRIDRKNTSSISFERAFEKLSPELLQARSFANPLARIQSKSFDYRYLERFEIPIPSYLKDDYGLDIKSDGGIDIQKIIRDDIYFVDSKEVVGVQVVDLIVSGIRRCLRAAFIDNESAAARLGCLMVEAPRGRVPINLVKFGNKSSYLEKGTSHLVRIMQSSAKPMIARPSTIP